MIYIKLDCTWRTTSSTIRSIPEIHFAKMEAGVRNMTDGANDRQAAVATGKQPKAARRRHVSTVAPMWTVARRVDSGHVPDNYDQVVAGTNCSERRDIFSSSNAAQMSCQPPAALQITKHATAAAE